MTDLVIIVIIAVIILLAVRSIRNKQSGGCCSSSDVKIKVKDKNADNYPHIVQVKVAGMTCSKCKMRVENAFNEEGMWAEVDLKSEMALVRMKEKVTDERIGVLLKRSGYEAVEIKWQ